MVEKHVLVSRPCPHTWRWWTKELTDLKKHANQLSHLSHKFCALPNHICHRASKDACNKLANEVFKAKKEHWQEWLEDPRKPQVMTSGWHIATSRPHLVTAAEHVYPPSKAKTTMANHRDDE